MKEYIVAEHPDFPYEEPKPQELIRCKDCKYYKVAELNYDGTPDKRCKPSVCTNGQYAVERPEGWYCGDAERKGEDG